MSHESKGLEWSRRQARIRTALAGIPAEKIAMAVELLLEEVRDLDARVKALEESATS